MSMLPSTPLELLTEPERRRFLLQRFAALSRIELVIEAEGRATRCPLRVSGTSAIISGKFTITTEDLDPETIVWRDEAASVGGTFGPSSIARADALIRAVKATSFNSKVVYILPLIGGNLATGLQPLRNSLGAPRPSNTGFVDADFSESTGLQGDGSSKVLDTQIRPGDLGTSGNGGLGWWENNLSLAGSGTQPVGCYNLPTDTRFGIPLAFQRFQWGDFATAATVGGSPPATNGHYYGQRFSATDRKLYFGGAVRVSNTGSDSAAGASGQTIRMMGADESGSLFYWPGRCACAYMTNGALMDAEVAAFHTLLDTYLITPTGR
jgi:hypothetical protein